MRRRALPSAASCRDRTCFDQLFEEFPSMQNPSDLLVQIDGGILIPIVDLIRRIYRLLQFKSQFPCDSGWSQAPRRQQGNDSINILCMIIELY
ncbi:hypothetical protein F511_28879 [Dorcoceras hygrometricum]|uniref:Uncharacterized protein n=1 Tax=Dorcoceras hygrometricum TaxID=472368 RepID=A0A2Z7D8C8_9LAMI|nr:hypothetical protein F511_28879 [Dorcoceras hygrometricum]